MQSPTRPRLLLLLVAVAAAASGVSYVDASTPAVGLRDLAAQDAQLAASLQQVTREQQALAERLDALRRRVEEFFVGEQRNTLAFMRDTRAKMAEIGRSVRDETRAALVEVRALLADVVADAEAMMERRKQQEGPSVTRNRTCTEQNDLEDKTAAAAQSSERLSEWLVPWEAIEEAVTRAVVGLVHYYELFAVAAVHYAVVVGIWVLLPVAAIAAVLVLVMALTVKLQARQRARRKPRVVYSGYLHSHRMPDGPGMSEARSSRPRNGMGRKTRRRASDEP